MLSEMIRMIEGYRLYIIGILCGIFVLVLVIVGLSLMKKKKQVHKTKNNKEEFDKTGLLNDEFGETCLLSDYCVPVFLFRKRTKERIGVSKQIFKIGKVSSQADYCILGNSNVSRLHATMLYRQGTYFILDEHSTNGTYVNGIRLRGEEEVCLKHGDTIRLADEEFEFCEY